MSTNPEDGAGPGSPLAAIDDIMRKRQEDERRAAKNSARLVSERSEFASEFTAACDTDIRPSMEAVLVRLWMDGGGGLILEQSQDATRNHAHRLTLWMSLSGEITGTPLKDRHPYLQLEAEPDKKRVRISAGDMWQGRSGNSSGPVANENFPTRHPPLSAEKPSPSFADPSDSSATLGIGPVGLPTRGRVAVEITVSER